MKNPSYGQRCSPEYKIVRHANPLSQQDGYLSSNWMTLNMTYVTQDPDTPFDNHPKLFAKMFGYCIASVHLKLPHTMIMSTVVSTTLTQCEGWPCPA